MLEALTHGDNTFATLTYSDDTLPLHESLVTEHARDWLKRLRKAYNRPVRYYLVGEYGEISNRPHYHAALFGVPNCEYGITRARKYCCKSCALIADTWGKGNIYLGDINPLSAQYIAGYHLKQQKGKLTAKQTPAYARMSNRPGLGEPMAHEIASLLMEMEEKGAKLEDVPIVLQHGEKEWPLGRYLRRKIRKYMGRAENAPEGSYQSEELQRLRTLAFNSSRSLKATVLESNLGKRINLEAKVRRHRRMGNL